MTKADIFNAVKANVIEVLPDLDAGAILPEKSLADLGANSVDRMEIITMTMEHLGISIPLLSFAKVTNIEGIVEVLAAHAG